MNLPDLPEGWMFERYLPNNYIWVRHGKDRKAVFCIDTLEDGDSTFHIEYASTGWNKPFEFYYGFETQQEAAQAVIALILVRGNELLERAYPGATAHSQEQS